MKFARFVVLVAVMAGGAALGADLKPDSTADQVLEALHARGEGLKDFSAAVVMTTVDERTGSTSSQSGRVIYQGRGGNGRIRVTFDQRKLENGDTQDYRLDYLLQDGWLVDRNWPKKSEVRRQVLRPGQKMDLLKLGEGPFPLPIGQPKDDVKKMFEVTKVPASRDDPKDTVHLKLVPRAGTRFAKQFREIDVYVDTKLNMPARIDTVERAGNVRTTELSNVKINSGVSDKDFELPGIEGQGWERKEEMFE